MGCPIISLGLLEGVRVRMKHLLRFYRRVLAAGLLLLLLLPLLLLLAHHWTGTGSF